MRPAQDPPETVGAGATGAGVGAAGGGASCCAGAGLVWAGRESPPLAALPDPAAPRLRVARVAAAFEAVDLPGFALAAMAAMIPAAPKLAISSRRRTRARRLKAASRAVISGVPAAGRGASMLQAWPANLRPGCPER